MNFLTHLKFLLVTLIDLYRCPLQKCIRIWSGELDMWVGGIRRFWVQTNHRKISNTYKGFELCQNFKHKFLSQIVPIFPLYILLTKRIDTFKCDGSDTFWSEGIGDSLAWKITSKKSAILSKIFWIIPFFWWMFIANCPEILILHTTQTTYYLPNPIWCHHPPQFINFLLSLYYLHQRNFMVDFNDTPMEERLLYWNR